MRTLFIFITIALLAATSVHARGHGAAHASKATPGGKHYVRTYMKKNGTIVVGHTAHNPSRP